VGTRTAVTWIERGRSMGTLAALVAAPSATAVIAGIVQRVMFDSIQLARRRLFT
jgi:hypothetical protein